MNTLIYIDFPPLWSHNKKEKNQENMKNGTIRTLEIKNQNNLLK